MKRRPQRHDHRASQCSGGQLRALQDGAIEPAQLRASWLEPFGSGRRPRHPASRNAAIPFGARPTPKPSSRGDDARSKMVDISFGSPQGEAGGDTADTGADY